MSKVTTNSDFIFCRAESSGEYFLELNEPPLTHCLSNLQFSYLFTVFFYSVKTLYQVYISCQHHDGLTNDVEAALRSLPTKDFLCLCSTSMKLSPASPFPLKPPKYFRTSFMIFKKLTLYFPGNKSRHPRRCRRYRPASVPAHEAQPSGDRTRSLRYQRRSRYSFIPSIGIQESLDGQKQASQQISATSTPRAPSQATHPSPTAYPNASRMPKSFLFPPVFPENPA